MKVNAKDSVSDFLNLVNRSAYFTKLKSDEKKDDVLTLELKVTGYNKANLLVRDLLKVSILALESDPLCVSQVVELPEVNVLGLLEIALQLLPDAEPELLDELHKLCLKL